MTTTNQVTTQIPLSLDLSKVTHKATVSAEADYTSWVRFATDVDVQIDGPVDAATINLHRSLEHPDSSTLGSVVATATGNPTTTGVGLTYASRVPAWYRVENAATFGPANAATARTLANLAAAINGLQSTPAGEQRFFAGTAPNPLVVATVPSATTMLLTAATAGAAGNAIATTETQTNGSFGAATLAGGADAVAASGTATFATGAAENGATVTIGTTVYTFRTALTTTATAFEVLRGASLTASRDNLLAAINLGGSVSTGLLTFTTAPADGDTVRIRNFVYTFRTSLTGFQNSPRQVLIGVSVTTARNNLVSAINGTAAGNGGAYSSATVPSIYFTAGTSGANMTIASISQTGLVSQYVTTAVSTHVSWGAAAMVSTAGPGITYGSATTLHPDVTGAAVSTNQLTATAKVAGTAGNAIATTTTSAANVAWGAATLASGAAAVKATGTLTMSGVFTNAQNVVVGAQTYVTKTTPTVANDINIAGLTADVVMLGTRIQNV